MNMVKRVLTTIKNCLLLSAVLTAAAHAAEPTELPIGPARYIPSLVKLAERGCVMCLALKEPKFALVNEFLKSCPTYYINKTLDSRSDTRPYTYRSDIIIQSLESDKLSYSQKIKVMDVVNRSADLGIDEHDRKIMGFLLGEAQIPGPLSVDSVARAIMHANMPALGYLVEEKKISLALPSSAKKYPLHYATEQDDEEMVRYLCEHGSNATDKDCGGYTPLHFVQSIAVANVLLEHGADVHAHADATDYRTNPIDTAYLSSRKDLYFFLRHERGDFDVGQH